MCDFHKMPMSLALPTLREASYIPSPSPNLGRREKEISQTSSSPRLKPYGHKRKGEEGWGGEGKIVAHRVS
jgi:hypothetical protein